MDLLGGLLGPSNRLPPGMAVMMPLAWAGCCWAWGFWMLRLPLRAWRNSVGLLEAGMVGRGKEKIGSRGLEPGRLEAETLDGQRFARNGEALALWCCCSALLWRWGGGRGSLEGRPDSFSALQRGARVRCAVRGTIQSPISQSPVESGGQGSSPLKQALNVGAWLRGSRGQLRAVENMEAAGRQLLGPSTGRPTGRPSLFLHVGVVGRADSRAKVGLGKATRKCGRNTRAQRSSSGIGIYYSLHDFRYAGHVPDLQVRIMGSAWRE